MPWIQWKPQFETGNLPYDDQHRALFALANQMHDEIQHWKGQEEGPLQLRFETFADLVELHSGLEDLLMHRHGHGTAGDHGEMHRAFLDHLKSVRAKGDFGPSAHPRILEALNRFRTHFEGEDEQRLLDLLRSAG